MPTSSYASPELSRHSYSLYLFILFTAPVAQSRHDAWPFLLIACLVFVLGVSVFTEILYKKIDFLPALSPYKYPLVLFALVCLWVFVQAIPLSAENLADISLFSASSFQDAGNTRGSISLAPGDTLVKGIFSIALSLFFIQTVLLHTSSDRIRLTLLIVVLSGTSQALYGSFMVLSGIEYGFLAEKTNYRGVATGTFFNRNHLAGYLEMCLACGIGLLVSSLGERSSRSWRARMRASLDALLGPKMRLRIFLAFMVIALVLTRSRMGNTAFFTALPVCGLLYMLIERKINWGAIILFASLMLVDFLIVGQWFGFEELAARLENTSTQTESRDEVARDSLDMVKANPVVGFGLGSYYTAFQSFQKMDIQGYYDHAHNDYLEFAADLGLLGMIPLALLVLLSFFAALYAMFHRRNKLAKGAAFATIMGLLSMLIHASVEFNLQIAANSLLFVFLISLGWMALNQEWRERH